MFFTRGKTAFTLGADREQILSSSEQLALLSTMLAYMATIGFICLRSEKCAYRLQSYPINVSCFSLLGERPNLEWEKEYLQYANAESSAVID